MDFKNLVTLKCVVKLYVSNSSQVPREHSCTFSVGTVDSETCFIVEGPGMRASRVKFKGHNIRSLTARKKGCLSITLDGVLWETVVISQVSDTDGLQKFHDVLERIQTASLKSSHGDLMSQTPPSTSYAINGSPFTAKYKSTSQKKKLLTHPNNRKNTALVKTAATQANSSKTPAGFYRSLDTAVSEPFLPSQHLSALRTKRKTPPYFSARRNLSSDMERHENRIMPYENGTAQYENGTEWYKNRTIPYENETTRQPPLRQPLSDLSEKRKNIAFSPNLIQNREGFANLGNTCYMNAVLQSLYGLEPFAEDILNYELVKRVHPKSLFRMIFLLVKSKRAKDSYESQKILLKKIKSVISHRASKFNSYRQQDAHELLGQCLDQLKDDVEHSSPAASSLEDSKGKEISTEVLCPVIQNFECEIHHTITCKSCGKVTTKNEVIYDFALQLPKSVLTQPTEQASLQQLFEAYFASEEVEFTCTRSCGGKLATLRHKISKLPRVVILHLKRYGYNTELSKNSKRVDNIKIPRSITIGDFCVADTTPPHEFKGPWPRDHSLLPAMVVKDKENSIPCQNAAPSLQKATTDNSVDSHVHSRIASISDSHVASISDSHVTSIPDYNVTSVPDSPSADDLVNFFLPQSHEDINKISQSPTHSSASLGDFAAKKGYSLPHEKRGNLDVPPSHSSTPLKNDTSVRGHSPPPVVYMKEKGLDVQNSTHSSTPLKDKFVSTKENPITLGKRRSSERNDFEVELNSNEDISVDSKSRKVQSDDGHDSNTIRDAASRVGVATTSNDSSSHYGSHNAVENIDEFDMLVASFQYDEEPISHSDSSISTKVIPDSGTNVAQLCHVAQPQSCSNTCETRLSHSGSNVIQSQTFSDAIVNSSKVSAAISQPMLEYSTVSSRMKEEDDLAKALEESLKAQPTDYQLLHLLDISEEEQLKLAMELSINDCSVNENTHNIITTSPSPAPEVVNFSSPVNPSSSGLEAYRLVSIVSHLGQGSGGGHYISDVYSVADRCWKTYNDSVVCDIREEEVRQQRRSTGYIFFYMHRSTFSSVSRHHRC